MEETKQLLDAIEESAHKQLAAEAEIVETRNLVLQIMDEIKSNPRVKDWVFLFSVKTLKTVEQIANGEYLTSQMREVVNAANEKGHQDNAKHEENLWR